MPLSPKGVDEVIIETHRKTLTSGNVTIKSEQISCPERLSDPHPLTVKILKALKTARIGERGVLVPRNKIYLDIRVTKSYVE